MLAVVLPQVDPSCPKSGREFWEVIISQTLSLLQAPSSTIRYSQSYTTLC
jgi:hypothetical protein